VKLRILVVFFALPLFAQDQKTDTSVAITPDYTVQCSTLRLAQAACRSYNEMVLAKDDDILSILHAPEAYVCFRNSEDMFSVVSIGSPFSLTFKKQPNGALLAAGMVPYRRLKSGQNDDYDVSFGNWITINQEQYPFFSSTPKQDPVVSVSESEISIEHSYKNLAGGTTDYTIQIRRSTLRATETIQWNNPGKDARSPPDRGDLDVDGNCSVFK
jgi:hypothetical protein